MKSLLIPLLTLLPMAPALAESAVPTLPGRPMPPGLSVQPNCADRFDAMMLQLQAGKVIGGAYSTLMVGSTAYAESRTLPPGPGLPDVGGQASRSGAGISGLTHVATPGATSRRDLSFTLDKAGGKARLRWSFDGKTYTSSVDSCSGGYWTASTTDSAITVKLGSLTDQPR